MTDETEDLLYPHLKRGEKLLWTGVSEKGFYFRTGEIITIALGNIFIFAALIPGYFGVLNPILALFFIVGFLMLIFGLFTGWWFRRRSRYALTDQRAFLIFNHPISGVQVTGYPITKSTHIQLYGKSPKSVFFARSDRVTVNNVPMPIGFARIKDDDMVHKLMLDIRNKAG